MKRTFLIIALISATLGMQAQHRINSFFDELGTVRIETQELDENADTIATIFHRSDDIVWSRIIYRIIDMRYKQNFQLYFPTNPESVPSDPGCSSQRPHDTGWTSGVFDAVRS